MFIKKAVIFKMAAFLKCNASSRIGNHYRDHIIQKKDSKKKK